MALESMKAVVVVDNNEKPGPEQTPTKDVAVKDVPVPKPGPDQVLVKVIAAGQNPTDWKHVQGVADLGILVGCDFAGTIEEIGHQVPEGLRKKGDRVCGFIHGAYKEEEGGSFAEYVAAPANLLIPLPDHLSYEDGSGLALCALTACQTLYQSLEVPILKTPSGRPELLLVSGGATGVGQFVVQLATLGGFQVIATASPSNFEYVKSLGAVACFDYHDPQVSAKIKEYTQGKLVYAVDCISEKETPRIVTQSMSDKGGKCAIILPVKNDEESGLRQDVKFVWSIVYTLLGLPCFHLDVKPEHVQNGQDWCKVIAGLVAEKKLKTVPIKVLPHGLASVKEGLQLSVDGKVHAQKLVFRIADTPGLKQGTAA